MILWCAYRLTYKRAAVAWGRNWNPNCQTYVEAGWIFGDYHLIICGFGCNHTQ
ncbi:MAG: hypothetical protein MR325_03060 [Helicobacter sp.]|nr:hypothetical protein [Helicobacter sp.]